MPNENRGEVTLDIPGVRAYDVRPTMELLSRIESQVAGIPDLWNRITQGQYRIGEIAQLVAIVTDVKLATVYEWMDEHGVDLFVVFVVEFSTRAIAGRTRYTGAKEKEPSQGEGEAEPT